MKKKIHKYARMLPPMSKEEYVQLRDDIAKRGLLQPILLYEDQILDGVHREHACEETDTKPKYKAYKGDEPLAEVVSLNVQRRQLSASQLAALALRLEPSLAKEAKQRMRQGGLEAGRGRNRVAQRSATLNGGKTSEVLGQMFHVGGRTIETAKRVKQKAPELFKEVEAGEITANTAERRIKERQNGTVRPKDRKYPQSVTRRRARARQKQLRKLDLGELQTVQFTIVKLWGALEGLDLGEQVDLDGYAVSLLLDLHDDLIAMGGWWDRSLREVEARLSDVDIRAKIAVLRDASGRTEAEAETAERMAEKLEQHLEQRLAAG